MRAWQLMTDEKSHRIIHKVAPGFGHALLAPMVVHAFEELRISATVWEHGVHWMPLHSRPTLESFEQQHGKDHHRHRYNDRMFARVLSAKRIVRGEYMGLCDLFAPIVIEGTIIGILVCGPFGRQRPTSADVLARWRWLTGRSGHPADPEFAAYLAGRLEVLVLEGTQSKAFERLVGCITQLMAGAGRADELANRAERLRAELDGARFVDRMWESARTMVDDRSTRRWQGEGHEKDRKILGLSRTAEDVLVGMMVARSKDENPLDQVLRRDAFQRAAAYLARGLGDVIAGRVGDHGVVFLSSAGGSPKSRKRRLLDLADRAMALASKHRLSLSFGLHLASPPAPVSRTYQVALSAAEDALRQGSRIALAESRASGTAESLRQLRDALAKTAEERPEHLPARFDRFLEAVAAQCGERVEVAQGHLDAAFERLAEPFVKTGTLDPKGLKNLGEDLERAASECRTFGDLSTAYRRSVADLCEARKWPVPARRDRSLRAALDHIHHHYAEPLPLERIARIAGFNPDHFSRLFKQREGTTFEHYLRGFRLDQAKRLLGETDLKVARIAEVCGFSSSQYFCRAFRQVIGSTPMQHRAQRGRARKKQRAASAG